MDIDWVDLENHCGKYPNGTVFESAWWATRTLNYLKLKGIDNMTTPQDTLHRLQERIRHLTELFEPDENGDNIFDTIKQLELQMVEIIEAQQRQENLMNLIIKLLGKDKNV
jgi:hypothetical protein